VLTWLAVVAIVHRCRAVYCIDASGDAPPLATTLAEAITLAYEELGVRISLRDPTGLVPGGATPLSPPEVLERLPTSSTRRRSRPPPASSPRATAP
jgi:hypothetical protein